MFPIRDTVPRRDTPWVVWSLLLLNGLVFLYQISLPPQLAEALVYHWGLVPARYTSPAWAVAHGLDPRNLLPFFTNTFMHGGWSHILMNMWTLWIFGTAVEDRMGHGRFLLFYLLCGVTASYTHYFFNTTSTIPALGASGAIAGVIGAYALLFPLARIIILVPIFIFPFFFEIHALVFAAIWFFLQVMQGTMDLLAPKMGGGVAWWAHIGGFAAGMALLSIMRVPQRRYFPDEGVLGYGPRGEAWPHGRRKNH